VGGVVAAAGFLSFFGLILYLVSAHATSSALDDANRFARRALAVPIQERADAPQSATVPPRESVP
jgi:hypothetical protein